MRRVVGTHDDHFQRSTASNVIAGNTELPVCFAGVGVKNSAVNPGSTTEHPTRDALQSVRDRGGRIVSISLSRAIHGFGYDDCAGHPRWFEPDEWLGGVRATDHPLYLLANQPATRLHSQLDGGQGSMDSKVQGHEPIRMHPYDAQRRALTAGDVVRVFTDRGSCLAGLVVDDGLRPGVVLLSTGACYPRTPTPCACTATPTC